MSAITGFFKRFTPAAGDPEADSPAPAPEERVPDSAEKSDTSGGVGGGGGGGGFFSGPSRILDSVNAKRNDLMQDISSKFDKLTTGLNANGKKAPTFRKKENDDDSSASEYGDGGDQPFYAEEAPNDRKGSLESLDSLPEDKASSMRQFMRHTVEKVYSQRQPLTQDDRTEFREHCQHHTGRSAFSKAIISQVLSQQRPVDESCLQTFAHLFTMSLHECKEMDDYVPAKYLMDAVFVLHSKSTNFDGSTTTKYLYQLLKELPIWHSIRFWNEALFEAVHKERTRQANNNNPAELSAIAFPIINIFIDRMMTFGLTKEVTYDFVRKQYSNLELEIEQMREIKGKIKQWTPN